MLFAMGFNMLKDYNTVSSTLQVTNNYMIHSCYAPLNKNYKLTQ